MIWGWEKGEEEMARAEGNSAVSVPLLKELAGLRFARSNP